MKLLTKVIAIFDRTIGSLTAFASVLIVFITLVVSTAVVTRYFLGRPIFWVVEVSGYSLLYITFLTAAWLLKKEGHVKMDMVLNRLKPRAQALLNMITSIISAITFLVIVRYSARATWEYFQNDYYVPGLLEPPQWIILVIIPIGSFLLSIQCLRRTYGYLASWRALSNKQ